VANVETTMYADGAKMRGDVAGGASGFCADRTGEWNQQQIDVEEGKENGVEEGKENDVEDGN
jgi:hypothetical protein